MQCHFQQNIGNAFITEGFTDWKHAKEKPSKNQPEGKGFYKHELSECRREAVERVITIHLFKMGG